MIRVELIHFSVSRHGYWSESSRDRFSIGQLRRICIFKPWLALQFKKISLELGGKNATLGSLSFAII